MSSRLCSLYIVFSRLAWAMEPTAITQGSMPVPIHQRTKQVRGRGGYLVMVYGEQCQSEDALFRSLSPVAPSTCHHQVPAGDLMIVRRTGDYHRHWL